MTRRHPVRVGSAFLVVCGASVLLSTTYGGNAASLGGLVLIGLFDAYHRALGDRQED